MTRLLWYNLSLHFQINLKIVIAINIVIALSELSPILAQTENQSRTQEYSKNNLEIPSEKVYLHLDRPYYSAGDDIWIKAYLVDAMTNILSDNSNNLNVELISPDSKIIKRLTLRMDEGLGSGDFHLGDSIASGNYQVRAYTNWMRNFGEIFFFKKEIVIENQIGIMASDQSKQEEGEKNIDVQFFSESGPLIENVYTLLGFKAVNSTGYGCNIKGHVFSSLGDTVESFASTHLGMGNFFFLPKKGLKYFAKGYSGNGISFRTDLPTALETGYSLKVSDINKDYFRVTIKTNQETLGQVHLNEMVINGTSHNSLCVTVKVNARGIDNPVILPKKEFPEGVALLTLMDTTGKKYCERAFYIHSRENYHISIIPDNEVYTPRQKVILQISVKDSSNNPVSANLSVSVVDGNQVKNIEKEQDIRSYLLLESEIRGYIEQPNYYFDTTVPDRYQALDNLLLTQGWRNFVWNYLSDTSIKFDYPIEKGLTISGRLRRIWGNKPIANANISMSLLGSNEPSYKSTQTDGTGKYYFEGLKFTGPQDIVINATDKNNVGQGLLLLDSINRDRDPAPVTYKLMRKPENKASEIPGFNEISQNMEITDYNEEALRKYNILKKYHITDTIALNEVEVNARRPEKENADGHFRLYGVPNFSLKVTDKMNSSPDVFQLLQTRVAGFAVFGDRATGYRFIFRGQASGQTLSLDGKAANTTGAGMPLFLLDNKEVDYATILALPVIAVDKIEVIKDGGKLSLYGFRGSFGAISVLTKRGSNGPIPPVLNLINHRVYGYYQARTFYAPKYKIPKPENEKPDLRTTIHWVPDIVTATNGNATISFFNSDNKGIIKVDVEGIAEPGVPVAGRQVLK